MDRLKKIKYKNLLLIASDKINSTVNPKPIAGPEGQGEGPKAIAPEDHETTHYKRQVKNLK